MFLLVNQLFLFPVELLFHFLWDGGFLHSLVLRLTATAAGPALDGLAQGTFQVPFGLLRQL